VEYADEMLEDWRLRQRLEEHLADCTDCQRRLEKEYEQNSVVQASLAVNRLTDAEREELKGRILETVGGDVRYGYVRRPGHVRIGPVEFRLSFWLPLAAAAAAFVLAFMIGRVSVARIAEMGGAVLVRRSGQGSWTEAGKRLALRSGDSLRTGEDSVELAFRDGSRVKLAASSELEIQGKKPGWRQVVYLNTGELEAEVTRSRSSFRVETYYGAASVVGTEFRTAVLQAGPSKIAAIEVAVELGTVEVSNAEGSRLAGRGERVLVGAETNPAMIGTDEAERAAEAAYKRAVRSLPASRQEPKAIRASIGELINVVSHYPNTRWADDSMWLMSLLEPMYALSEGQKRPAVSELLELCEEWERRYRRAARLQQWTVANFPPLLRGERVASGSTRVSCPAEMAYLMLLQRAEIYGWVGGWYLKKGEPGMAVRAYYKGARLLEGDEVPSDWLGALRAEIRTELSTEYRRLKARLEEVGPSAVRTRRATSGAAPASGGKRKRTGSAERTAGGH